jgi:hypothetical protein
VSKEKTSQSDKDRGSGGAGIDTGLYCRTQEEAAAYLGVATKTVRRYKNERSMPMSPDGWYIKAMLDLWYKNEKGEGGVVEHRQRDTIAQAGIRETKQKLIEIELAEKQGLVHNVADCEQRLLRKQVIILREATVLKKKIVAQLAPKDRAAANKIIKEAIVNMRTAIIGSE